ncbi:MAG: undecaprenyl-diphosphatase UppP [Nitrospirae bacterium]|nr:undecaprenyl-diphosphatase UppP [Nitrospirota bacterium]
MQLISAAILGLVQGLTEFLPISSTAHLVLFPWAFGWDDPLLSSLTFDVALHMGTLVAVLIYFRNDWLRLISAFFRSVRTRSLAGTDERLVWLILAATLPAGVLGLMFEDYVETTLRSPAVIACTLAGVAVLMMLAERAATGERRPISGMTLPHALVIGFAQACALIPGVSRSGATITAGLWQGYTRDDAARFSFLLSTPVIAGACVFKLDDVLAGLPAGEGAAFAVGMLCSAVSGYMAIAFLINYLKRHPLNVFAYYRFALAAVILVLMAVK